MARKSLCYLMSQLAQKRGRESERKKERERERTKHRSAGSKEDIMIVCLQNKSRLSAGAHH